MWGVWIENSKGYRKEYFFIKQENAEAFFKNKVKDFIRLQKNRGYKPPRCGFGYDTYEEVFKECVKHGEIPDVGRLFKIVPEDKYWSE